jgi:small subunit ribosomal protein S1
MSNSDSPATPPADSNQPVTSEPSSDGTVDPSSASAPATETNLEQPTEKIVDAAGAKPSGPLSLARIREMRSAQSASGQDATSKSPSADASKQQDASPGSSGKPSSGKSQTQSPTADAGNKHTPAKHDSKPSKSPNVSSEAQRQSAAVPRIQVPNTRDPLSAELQADLDEFIADADFDGLLVGSRELKVGRGLEEGVRYPGKIVKIHNDDVFVSLGGPDEGIVPLLHFNETPKPDDDIEVIIRAFNNEDGLYDLAIPGEAVAAEDWSDVHEGNVVEAVVESANTGGLECKVGSIRAFMPMSQIADYRVETPTDFVGQKLLCVVNEANPRKGNLVISHRAILEREREEKKKERLESITPGEVCDGVVRRVTDFGAFVDIGGLDGLIHISQLSWDRVKHPSEVVNEGDEIQVKVEKVDKETGKIGLSYRALQDHPWEGAEAQFTPGNVVKGTVTRLATFGAFVKLTTGIEGLIHISELSNKRVASVGQVVNEGDEVEVKVLTFDADAQRIALSMKQAKAGEATDEPAEDAVEEPPRKPVISKRSDSGPLKGGTGKPSGGEQFGLRF